MSATYPAHFRKTHHAPILSDQRDFGRYVSGFITPTSIWGLDLLQIGQTHNDKGIRTFVDAVACRLQWQETTDASGKWDDWITHAKYGHFLIWYLSSETGSKRLWVGPHRQYPWSEGRLLSGRFWVSRFPSLWFGWEPTLHHAA